MSNILLNQIFSRKMINDIINEGHSESLEITYRNYFSETNKNNFEKLSSLYAELRRNYRNEYYFKNLLINKKLFGIYSVNTTTALTELPVEKSKVDMVILNGKAHAYEIKTSLDSLERIKNQIFDYYKVFNYVTVLTDEVHLNKLIDRYKNTPVGISLLTKRDQISTKKEAEEFNVALDYLSIYKILRKTERYQLLECFFDNIPIYNQFEEYDKLFNWFNRLDLKDIYPIFIALLKERSNAKENKAQMQEVPVEIKSLVYFGNYNENQYYALREGLLQ